MSCRRRCSDLLRSNDVATLRYLSSVGKFSISRSVDRNNGVFALLLLLLFDVRTVWEGELRDPDLSSEKLI